MEREKNFPSEQSVKPKQRLVDAFRDKFNLNNIRRFAPAIPLALVTLVTPACASNIPVSSPLYDNNRLVSTGYADLCTVRVRVDGIKREDFKEIEYWVLTYPNSNVKIQDFVLPYETEDTINMVPNWSNGGRRGYHFEVYSTKASNQKASYYGACGDTEVIRFNTTVK